MTFDLQLRQHPALRLLAASGTIDHGSVEAFRLALAPHLAECRAEQPPLVLDLSGVPYISSIGLRELVLAGRQANAQGGRFVLAALSPGVQAIFRVTRFDLVFQVFDSVDAVTTEHETAPSPPLNQTGTNRPA